MNLQEPRWVLVANDYFKETEKEIEELVNEYNNKTD